MKILKRNGFFKIDYNGSHIKFHNPFTNRTVIEKTFPICTVKSIWK
ncbi:type II toxin-antitoxin system HicA family toxin [Enterococcus cecorum]